MAIKTKVLTEEGKVEIFIPLEELDMREEDGGYTFTVPMTVFDPLFKKETIARMLLNLKDKLKSELGTFEYLALINWAKKNAK